MKIDSKLAGLLSNLFLDISKAILIASFITPGLSQISSWIDVVTILARGSIIGIFSLIVSWKFAKLEEVL